MGHFLGIFEKPHSFVKIAVATVWATFGNIWATFYSNIWSHWLRQKLRRFQSVNLRRLSLRQLLEVQRRRGRWLQHPGRNLPGSGVRLVSDFSKLRCLIEAGNGLGSSCGKLFAATDWSCHQIRPNFMVLAAKFRAKVAQIFDNFFWLFWKRNFLPKEKNCGKSFGQLVNIFIQTSGHHVKYLHRYRTTVVRLQTRQICKSWFLGKCNFLSFFQKICLFLFISGLVEQKNRYNFCNKSIWKMSITYPILGFNHTTPWTGVVSHNHSTRAPALGICNLMASTF